MKENPRRCRKALGMLLLLAFLGGGILLWMERSSLLASFYLYQLKHAGLASRERWAHCVAELGDVALPGLLDLLQAEDTEACSRARLALEQMSTPWGAADPRTVDLAYSLARDFSRFSGPGQGQALELTAGWFASLPAGASAAPGLLSACTRMLTEVVSHPQMETEAPAIDLCGYLLSQPDSTEVLSPAQELVRKSLASTDNNTRLQAIRLALYRGMDLLDPIVGLLRDPAPEVRRAALLAVGPIRDAVHEETLLPCLHDLDPEIRRLARTALEGRGLKPEYIALGRLLIDPRPAQRLCVLDHLSRSADLDPSIWLRRLSHDPSPAVRVAAMRVMATQQVFDLSDRLAQMAATDPSPTVCQLAQFYLELQRPTARRLSHENDRALPTEGVMPVSFEIPPRASPRPR